MEKNKTKKILILVTNDVGGAAEYMYKIMHILKKLGYEVVMNVKIKTKVDDSIIEINTPPKKRIPILKKLLKKINKRKYSIELDPKYHYYGLDETTVNIKPNEYFDKIGFIPDIIISGWTSGFLNSSELLILQQFSNARVYTVTADMNNLTGGCHYAWDCNGYINGCSTDCPAITNPYFKELSKTNFDTKLRNAHKGNFKVIVGSGWTLNQAKKSKIYKDQQDIVNINSLIDTEVMCPKNKKMAKAFLILIMKNSIL